jgi:hypothetical protein
VADADTDPHVPLSLMTIALNSRHPLPDAVGNHSTLCPTAHPPPSYISDIPRPTSHFRYPMPHVRCPISVVLGLELVNLRNLVILLDRWHEEREETKARKCGRLAGKDEGGQGCPEPRLAAAIRFYTATSVQFHILSLLPAGRPATRTPSSHHALAPSCHHPPCHPPVLALPCH